MVRIACCGLGCQCCAQIQHLKSFTIHTVIKYHNYFIILKHKKLSQLQCLIWKSVKTNQLNWTACRLSQAACLFQYLFIYIYIWKLWVKCKFIGLVKSLIQLVKHQHRADLISTGSLFLDKKKNLLHFSVNIKVNNTESWHAHLECP